MRRLIIILVLIASLVVVTASDVINMSAPAGLSWSTVKEEEEGDLLIKKPEEADHNSLLDDDHNDIDGGFSSLDGMLQWAIGHSDPSKLKEAAHGVQALSPDDLNARQTQMKELMEKLKMPSDAELMQIAINDLNNVSLPLEDHHRALQELLVLVEPIDNANDLGKLGGFIVVVRELSHPDPQIRTASAWIIGKASQNNPIVQKQILGLGALPKIMEMVQSNFTEEAIKAFYAVSSLIRNNFPGQQLFYAQAGDLLLQNILSNPSIDMRLQRKSLFLVADLVECHLGSRNEAELPFSTNRFFLKTVVDFLMSTDVDLQEKALYAVKNLLQLKSMEVGVFKDFCELDVALGRMRKQLQQLMIDENHRDFAADVESLRREVELIFTEKLDKVQ